MFFNRGIEHKKLSSHRVVSLVGKDGFSRPNVGDGFPRNEWEIKNLPMSVNTSIKHLDEVIIAPYLKFSGSPKLSGFVDYCYFTGSFIDWLDEGGSVDRVLVFCENYNHLEETIHFVETIKKRSDMSKCNVVLTGVLRAMVLKNELVDWHTARSDEAA